MPSAEKGGRGAGARVSGPSMLDLVRLSPEEVFPPGGEALYRQIALLVQLENGLDLLDAACGRGISTQFLVSTYGVEGAGVEPDPGLVSEAEARARQAGLSGRLEFQRAALEDLPYKDGIFDVSIGEIGLAAAADPAHAVAELARVTRPMGSVVLIQLIWTGNVDPERREDLVRHLGARPMLLVEWKQMLRDAGVVDLHVEDWSDRSSPFRPASRSPFPDFTELFSLREKIRILRRAFQRWGWRGIRGAVVREREIQELLTRERVLGLTLIKGTRWKNGHH